MPVSPTNCPAAVFLACPKRDAGAASSLDGAPPNYRRPCSPQNPPWLPWQALAGPWSLRVRRDGASRPEHHDARRHGSPRCAATVRQSVTRHASKTAESGGQRLAALATTGRQDGPTGTSAHPEPEPVGSSAATVVRLESALTLTHAQNLLVSTSSSPVVRRVVPKHGSLWCLLPTCGLVTSSDDKQGHTKSTRRKRETLRGYAPATGPPKPPPRPRTATTCGSLRHATLQHRLATRRTP
jgi:hypothetical protein